MEKLIFKKITYDINLFFFITIICVSAIVWIIQAVNYLDLISEDGHSIRVYFLYTLFSLPKIISKILPFIYMISIFYIIISYELNNELIIYWLNGITKINFINVIIKISFIYFFLQLFLTTIVVPYSLDKGRSFFRTSNIDLFTSIIKEKKFIDTVEDLTIFVEKKESNFLKNIIIKEKINDSQSQIIIAQSGDIIIDRDEKKKIILNNGKIINTENRKQTIIDFSSFNLDLSKFNTNSITHPKIQEISSVNLLKCIKKINNFKKLNTTINKKNFFLGCNLTIRSAIFEEFLKRFFTPIFIILIGLSSSLIITSNKNDKNYKLKNLFKFILSIFFIIFSQITLRYSGFEMKDLFIYLLMPILFFLVIYIYILFEHKKTQRETVVN